jgi:LytS/YehU family sensor histidine kinase
LALSSTEPDTARRLLVDIDDFIRSFYVPNKDNGFIPLDNEVKFLKAYTEIEQIRLDNLIVLFDIEYTQISVPHLCLQPLVENAINHGVRKKIGGGSVTVYSKLRGNRVIVGVRDDGVGFDSSNIDILNSGKGIRNANLRLNKLYGTDLIFESTIGEGTNVYFEIPVK